MLVMKKFHNLTFFLFKFIAGRLRPNLLRSNLWPPPKEIQSCILQGMPSLGRDPEIPRESHVAIVISGGNIWLCHGARACHSSFELFAVALVYVQARKEIPPSVHGNLAIVVEIM